MPSLNFCRIGLVSLVAAFALLASANATLGSSRYAEHEANPVDDPVTFNRDVRSILSSTCFRCHGQDVEHRAADLRLDQAEGAVGSSDEGAAFVPGDAANSHAWQRINSTDPDLVMPPPSANRQLSDDEKVTLQRWIDQGAKYERHWAFEPLQPGPAITQPLAPSKFKFQQHGQCGRWVSELLPFTAELVDELAVVKTVHTNAINHDPACTFVMTGSEVPGKASLGSWLAYGLGSESNDLPAFVVLTPTWSATAPAQALFTRMWASGYLPTRFTGVALRSGADPVLYLQNPAGVLPAQCRDVDQACAALLKDLKQRGLLDSTLVVWGGEFGRTVYCQGGLTRENYGRDHHPKCFTMWMAGGGIRGGVEYGVTDDFSYNVVQNPVHVNDINATLLHCLGIDHERFTFSFQGLEQRLTGVEPQRVIREIVST